MWCSSTPLPSPRSALAVDVLDGKIYCIGGYGPSVQISMYLDVAQMFDPETCIWTTLPHMPTPRSSLGLCAMDGKLFAAGGTSVMSTGMDILEIFDVATQTWSLGASMATPRANLAIVALGGKIYALGGEQLAAHNQQSVEVYDPCLQRWQPSVPMQTRRTNLGCCVLGNKLYICGGTNSVHERERSSEVFDPSTQTWTTIAPMNSKRSSHGMCATSGRIFAFGGHNGDGWVDSCEVYNPIENKWRVMPPMLRPRTVTACSVDGCAYALGGYNGHNFLSDFDCLCINDGWSIKRHQRFPWNKLHKVVLVAVLIGYRANAINARNALSTRGRKRVREVGGTPMEIWFLILQHLRVSDFLGLEET
eukprot:m.40589 g.40589  ORF g.40589 m.40589 type:complete len:363 (+) comp18539_c0_seq1:680-1768(+)